MINNNNKLCNAAAPFTLNTKNQFFIKLNRVIADIGNTKELFLLSDFNDKTGREVNNKIINPYGEQ